MKAASAVDHNNESGYFNRFPLSDREREKKDFAAAIAAQSIVPTSVDSKDSFEAADQSLNLAQPRAHLRGQQIRRAQPGFDVDRNTPIHQRLFAAK